MCVCVCVCVCVCNMSLFSNSNWLLFLYDLWRVTIIQLFVNTYRQVKHDGYVVRKNQMHNTFSNNSLFGH